MDGLISALFGLFLLSIPIIGAAAIWFGSMFVVAMAARMFVLPFGLSDNGLFFILASTGLAFIIILYLQKSLAEFLSKLDRAAKMFNDGD